ncbi:MAG: glycosyltransferase family 9 protein, partial [Candidatus Zixiibacteriota bacterium]
MQNILIIRFSSLGDIVLTEPIARRLRKIHPGAKIHYLTKAHFGEVVSMFDGVDEIHLWRSEESEKALIEKLREIDFDLTVDLHNNIRSHKIRASIGTKWVSTNKEWFKRFASVRLRWLKMKPSHAIDRYAGALKSLGYKLEFKYPQLTITENDAQKWQSHKRELGIAGEYYCIAAGAAHETKRAPSELWVDIARQVRGRLNLKALLIGSPEEKPLLDELRNMVGENCVGVLHNEGIGLTAAAISESRFVLSNDSGAAHLAAALGKPVVALFGPTHPILGFEPRGERAGHYTVNEYCSPCSLHGKRPCHRDQRYCFGKMNAGEIVAQVEGLMKKA